MRAATASRRKFVDVGFGDVGSDDREVAHIQFQDVRATVSADTCGSGGAGGNKETAEKHAEGGDRGWSLRTGCRSVTRSEFRT